MRNTLKGLGLFLFVVIVISGTVFLLGKYNVNKVNVSNSKFDDYNMSSDFVGDGSISLIPVEESSTEEVLTTAGTTENSEIDETINNEKNGIVEIPIPDDFKPNVDEYGVQQFIGEDGPSSMEIECFKDHLRSYGFEIPENIYYISMGPDKYVVYMNGKMYEVYWIEELQTKDYSYAS